MALFDQDPVTVCEVVVTADILRHICPHTNYDLLQEYAPFLQKALCWADAITSLRAAHFVSQIAYETAWFGTMIEAQDPANTINPKTPFDKYELGTFPDLDAAGKSIAKRLGNTCKGDGAWFKGMGWPQITGRDNYTLAGIALGLDLVNHPELAAVPLNAARLAAWFWTTHFLRVRDAKGALTGETLSLNDLADKDDCSGVTRVINGGQNGLPWRLTALQHAKEGFGLLPKAA